MRKSQENLRHENEFSPDPFENAEAQYIHFLNFIDNIHKPESESEVAVEERIDEIEEVERLIEQDRYLYKYSLKECLMQKKIGI